MYRNFVTIHLWKFDYNTTQMAEYKLLNKACITAKVSVNPTENNKMLTDLMYHICVLLLRSRYSQHIL